MSEHVPRQPLPPPHPAKAVIVARGETITHVARAIDCRADVLGQVLNRRRSSSARLRRAVSDYLGLPEAECFFESEVVA